MSGKKEVQGMAITKVWIDEDACAGCGICEDTYSEVFELNDVAKVKKEADFDKFEKKRKDVIIGKKLIV